MQNKGINLPADLSEFLGERKQLKYDPTNCEAGTIILLPLHELKLERFPVETGTLSIYQQDPHYPQVNSYLVLGVNLVAECEEYEPEGLLLWLPIEKRYGIWDSSHCGIQIFGTDVDWQKIVADPVSHINAGWSGIDENSPKMEDLIPWPNHPYADRQLHEPQPS